MQVDGDGEKGQTRRALLLIGIEACFGLVMLGAILAAGADVLTNCLLLGATAAGFIGLRLGLPRLLGWRELYRTTFHDRLAAVAGLALLARLVFILVFNHAPVIWDARLYWNDALAIHNAVCDSLHSCPAIPVTRSARTAPDLLQEVFMTRSGLLPALVGLLITLAPAKALSGYFLYAILDSLTVALTAAILLRLKAPRRVALLAALIQAFYIPTILIDGTLAQQPLILFGLTVCLWGFIHAFTAADGRGRMTGCALGTAGAFLTGYASLTTRPLMWGLIGLAIGLAVVVKRYRPVLKAQMISLGGLVVVVAGLCGLLVGRNADTNLPNVASTMITGLSSAGAADQESTPVSFPYFWGDSTWRRLGGSATVSLGKDVSKNPVQFAKWLDYSMVSNWRYPSNGLFQGFILSQDQLVAQHTLWLALGLIGLLWFLGRPPEQIGPVLLIVAACAYTSVVNSIVSVEPRRMLEVSPVVSIGAAFCLWLIGRYGRRLRPWALGLIGATIIAWLIPFGWFYLIAPVAASTAYAILFVTRFVLAGAAAAGVIALLRKNEPGYSATLPGLFLATTLIAAAAGLAQEPDWQSWAAPSATTYRQEVSHITAEPNSLPWLIVDTGSAAQARSLTIRVNGQVVKPAGKAMAGWRAGLQSTWSPFKAISRMQTIEAQDRTWLAVPLPPDILSQERLTIDLETGGEPVALYGNYPASAATPYAGPILSPWYDGWSFRLWTWSLKEGRIPWPQQLNGEYHSSYFDGQSWHSDDLSSGAGLQTGLYRVFVVQEPFGPKTNALLAQIDKTIKRCPDDPAQHQLTPSAKGLPAICKYTIKGQGALADLYDPSGQLLGTSKIRNYNREAEEGDVVDRIESASGRVVVIKAPTGLYVANIYTPDGELSYSLLFH